MIDVKKKFHECWTYFMVRYDENFDMKDFCQKLDLDYEHQKNMEQTNIWKLAQTIFISKTLTKW
ncbi:MAG: hypothetical protein IKV34_04790 [Clostridia bacterium]|nr:hypothetical protein [Clostridia bacterium]